MDKELVANIRNMAITKKLNIPKGASNTRPLLDLASNPY